MHIEIYAANLRQGGAVVTAASLIDGILELLSREWPDWLIELDLIVSPQVLTNITNCSLIALMDNCVVLTVREDHPRRAFLRKTKARPDLRYVVFGPEYGRSRARLSISGFADGTLIQSWFGDSWNSSGPTRTRYRDRFRRKLKRCSLLGTMRMLCKPTG